MRKLVCFFAGRGCRDAEDLAVECVLRVAAKCGDVDASAYEDRAGYFYGVARNVLHEWWRDEVRESTKRESLRAELARLGVPDAAVVGPEGRPCTAASTSAWESSATAPGGWS